MDETLDTLRGIRGLFSDPFNWIQGESARDDKGYSVNASSDCATRFCLTGAAYHITFDTTGDTEEYLDNIRESVFSEICKTLGEVPTPHENYDLVDELWDILVDYNDKAERTYENIIEVLDKTIRRLDES